MANHSHEEHRKRVREEFLKVGINEATPPHKVLEMLLFFAIPRKDTNEIAHDLLDYFGGSIANVLEASPEELQEVKGIGPYAASLIALIIPLLRIYETEKQEKRLSFNNMEAVYKFLERKYFGYDKEVFAITCFNGRGEVCGFEILNKGDVASVNISTRQIIETVLHKKALCVVISHNHPNGVALPSSEDITLTQNISSALSHINVQLMDHVIFAGNDYVSMRQTNGLRYLFD